MTTILSRCLPVLLLINALVVSSSAAASQLGQFDSMNYVVPQGYEVQSANSASARSFLKKNSRTGKFSLLILYATTGSLGNANTDFARRWKQLVMDTGSSSAAPKNAATTAVNHTIVSGIGEITHEGRPAGALLTTVTTTSKRLITILLIFNDEHAPADYQSFMNTLDVSAIVDTPLSGATTITPAPSAQTSPSRPLPSVNGGASSSSRDSNSNHSSNPPKRFITCNATGSFQPYCSPGTFCATKFASGIGSGQDLAFARNAAIVNCNNNARAQGGSAQCVVGDCN